MLNAKILGLKGCFVALMMSSCGLFGEINYQISVDEKGNLFFEQDGEKDELSIEMQISWIRDVFLWKLENTKSTLRLATEEEVRTFCPAYTDEKCDFSKNWRVIENENLFIIFNPSTRNIIIQINPQITIDNEKRKILNLNVNIEDLQGNVRDVIDCSVKVCIPEHNAPTLNKININARDVIFTPLFSRSEGFDNLCRTGTFTRINKNADAEFQKALKAKGLTSGQIALLRAYLFFNANFTSKELALIANVSLPAFQTEHFSFFKKSKAKKSKIPLKKTAEDVHNLLESIEFNGEKLKCLLKASEQTDEKKLLDDVLQGFSLTPEQRELFDWIFSVFKTYPDTIDVLMQYTPGIWPFLLSRATAEDLYALSEALRAAQLTNEDSINKTRSCIFFKDGLLIVKAIDRFLTSCKEKRLSSQEFNVLWEEIVANPHFSTESLIELVESWRIPASIRDKGDLVSDKKIECLKNALRATGFKKDLLNALRSQISYGLKSDLLKNIRTSLREFGREFINSIDANTFVNTLIVSIGAKNWVKKKNSNIPSTDFIEALKNFGAFSEFGIFGTKLLAFLESLTQPSNFKITELVVNVSKIFCIKFINEIQVKNLNLIGNVVVKNTSFTTLKANETILTNFCANGLFIIKTDSLKQIGVVKVKNKSISVKQKYETELFIEDVANLFEFESACKIFAKNNEGKSTAFIFRDNKFNELETPIKKE